jgi:two-component system, cell cycle sensor histidine kinase and response regulator CckA
LPLARREVRQHIDKAAPAECLDGAETILLVEDEARVRKLILDVLTARGYMVLEATRGEEALRLCRQYRRKIDLSVIDVVMPEMSGPDLVRQLKPLKPKMRVLYISGYTDEAIVHHGILRSGAAFLQKPFLPDMLARKVREVLDSNRNSAPKS